MNKLISENIKYDGPRFSVIQKIYERENGFKYVRDCVEPGNAVVILPINENNEVVFVKQYREVIGKVTLELPAGMIDKDEIPENAAKRELEEETGFRAKDIKLLTSYYPSCGYTSEKLYIYIAKNFELGSQHFDDTEEILNVEKIHIDKCLEYALEDKFDHASVNIAILMYYFKYIREE